MKCVSVIRMYIDILYSAQGSKGGWVGVGLFLSSQRVEYLLSQPATAPKRDHPRAQGEVRSKFDPKCDQNLIPPDTAKKSLKCPPTASLNTMQPPKLTTAITTAATYLPTTTS